MILVVVDDVQSRPALLAQGICSREVAGSREGRVVAPYVRNDLCEAVLLLHPCRIGRPPARVAIAKDYGNERRERKQPVEITTRPGANVRGTVVTEVNYLEDGGPLLRRDRHLDDLRDESQ